MRITNVSAVDYRVFFARMTTSLIEGGPVVALVYENESLDFEGEFDGTRVADREGWVYSLPVHHQFFDLDISLKTPSPRTAVDAVSYRYWPKFDKMPIYRRLDPVADMDCFLIQIDVQRTVVEIRLATEDAN